MSRIWILCLPGLLTLGSLPGLLLSEANSDRNTLDNGRGMTLVHRHKRSTTCLDKYKAIPHHTACLEKSSKASSSGVNSHDQQAIVDLHNKYRAEEKATNMLKLTWDADIANIAQKWADGCDLVHDANERRSIPGKLRVGQNLAMGAKNWTVAINLWKDEKTAFTFGGSNVFEDVGHYTQLVWAGTHKIGCGYALCGTTDYHVCNYGPAGNMNGYDKPYKSGAKCADCPGHCPDKLCDCPTTCLNSADMILSNCTCKCRREFYTGAGCELDCSKVKKDPEYCDGDYGDKSCEITSVDCPNKCHVCPYAGINYKEGSTPISERPGGMGTSARGDVITVITMATLVWMMTIVRMDGK